MNTYTVLVDGIFGVKGGRSMALRKCAWESPALHMEFKRFVRNVVDHNDFSEKTKAFVREKGLRVISEKPVVRTENDRYRVDVYYTIGW